MSVKRAVWILFWWLTSYGISAHGMELMVSLLDKTGQPFQGAVVSAKPNFEWEQPEDYETYHMSQSGKIFSPHILAIPQGASVSFPNLDNITHHVYSFSETKRFDLKLFKLNTPDPVTFDKTGVVVVGCNIHDWMLGYIKVVPTPFIARTNEQGQATLSELPAGSYDIEVWHPRIKDKKAVLKQTTIVNDKTPKHVSFNLKKRLRAQPDLSETEDEDY